MTTTTTATTATTTRTARTLGVLDLVVVTISGFAPFRGEIVAVRDGAFLVSYRCGRNREWFPAGQVAPRPRRYIG